MISSIKTSDNTSIDDIVLFSTRLYTKDNFLPLPLLSHLSEIAEDKANVDDDLLKRSVIDFGLGALRADNVDLEHYESIELSEIWFNVLDAGGHHWDHTHANHILSGVIYLTDDCFTIFGDPRPAASVLSLTYKNPNPGSIRSFVHHGKKNSIVTFPSWLGHRVATSQKSRTTIA